MPFSDLTLISQEFHEHAGGDLWPRIEEACWRSMRRRLLSLQEYKRWWQATTLGKRQHRQWTLARNARLKCVVAAIVACKACGKLFPQTAYQRSRRQGRVCSTRCRPAMRRNIALITIRGETMSLARWAERYGIPLNVVIQRRKLGWSLLRALETPVRVQRPRRAA